MNEDTTKLVQAIAAGRHDDDLGDIATAVVARVKDTLQTFAWRFTLDEVSVNELEVTLDEWSEIQQATGVHFAALTPEVNVDHLRAVGRVLLHTRGGLDRAEAAARVGALTAPDIPTVVTRELTGAPFASATPATT